MSYVEQRSNENGILRYYYIKSVSHNINATQWVCDIAWKDGFEAKSIALIDPTKDESKNQSLNLPPTTLPTYIRKELLERYITKMEVRGKFHEKPFVAGVDMLDFGVYIKIESNEIADIVALEKALDLDK